LIKKLIESSQADNIPPTNSAAEAYRASSLFPIISCTTAYIFYILLSVAVIFNISGFVTQMWLSIKFAWVGKWIPRDLGLASDAYVSRQNTGFLELMLLLALTFAAYGLSALIIHRQLRRQDTQSKLPLMMRLIWLGTLLGGCIYLFTPGLLASDVYSYASYGRILIVHAANPYFVPPSAFPQDPVYHLLYWKDTVSIYGPIWMGVCSLLALLGGSSQEGLLLAFRIFALAAHLLNIWLVTAILRAMGRSERTVVLGTLLYAWNPLVLSESSLGGHNDVFMVTFLLLGLLLSARAETGGQDSRMRLRTYILPLIAFSLAALVKFSAVPMVAIFILALCCKALQPAPSQTKGERNPLRWRFALLTTLTASCISAGLALALYSPFWMGHSIKDIVNSFILLPSAVNAFNSILFTLNAWNSVYSLPQALIFLTDRKLWNIVNSIGMILPVVLGAVYLWRAPTTRTIALVSLATLAIFLVVTPWFFAWYVTWLVGLAAICLPVAHERLARGLMAFTLTLSATAFLTYYSTLIGWYLLSHQPHNADWAVLVCIGELGIPLLALLAGVVSRRSWFPNMKLAAVLTKIELL